jgi:hypothetical protein
VPVDTLDGPRPRCGGGHACRHLGSLAASEVARIAVRPKEAAAMLGVDRHFFDQHVRPGLRLVRTGRKVILVPVAELDRWVEANAARWSD